MSRTVLVDELIRLDFSQMKPESIGWLLHCCSKAKELRYGISLHAHVIKAGLQSDVVVSNHILNVYAKCRKIPLARKVLDEMSERNLVSWSAMISGYDQAGEHLKALQLFRNMRMLPNEYVYASVISACANIKVLVQGQQIHAQAMKHGYGLDSFVCNSLVSMYMECGCCSDALLVYDEMEKPNVVSYNALITGFLENKQGERGFEVFNSMTRQGLLPDRFTFAGLLEACSDSDNMERGIALHCQAIKLRLDSTPFVGNVIIAMYSQFNLIEEAEGVFRLIEEKDAVSWNTFIAACCHCVGSEKGLRVFREMLGDCSVWPDNFTFASVLAACAGLASIRHGKQIHTHLIRTKPNLDVGVENALVNMYAKCGCIGYAHGIFNRMLHRNLVSWNTIIAGFGNHGAGGKALELFDEMKERGLKPDSVTFVGLLTACNHTGLVDKGLHFFNSMEEVYGANPDIEHFSCLIDLLGRAGRLQEAEEYLRKYNHFGRNPIILGSLLSACRLHGDVAVGELLAKRLMELQLVTSSSPYVLLSNLYASDEMWDGVAEARKLLKGSGLKKEPGHSLIEIEGKFEKFTKGNFSHSRMGEVKNILKMLRWPVDEIPLDSVNPS